MPEQHRRKTKDGFFGVAQRGARWTARLGVEYLGTFSTAIAACLAYDAAAITKYGADAVLNNPDGGYTAKEFSDG